MLDRFVMSNRDTIIERARARVAARISPKPTDTELVHGIPAFLNQLGEAIGRARKTDVVDHGEIRQSAGRHGEDLFRLGLTIGQVVHDYGDVCQVITELAMEQDVSISPEEFRTLNLCLDDGIADAVTEFARQRERVAAAAETERLGVLAHELRNVLNTAMIAYDTIKSGQVPVGGSTGLVLDRSFLGLRDLIDRSLADVRLDAGIKKFEIIRVAQFLEEVEIGANMQARANGLHLDVASVDKTLAIEGDRQILAAALSNLLQNAFKFTRKRGSVTLSTRATSDRVLFSVEDECGGLPPGKAGELFRPFEQRGADRSGLGLGLSICLKAAKANAGDLSVRDLPGKGCIFTMDLPRRGSLPPSHAG